MGRFYFELCGSAISRASSLLNEEGGRRQFSRRRPGRFQRNQKHWSLIGPAASSALTWRAPAGPPEARRPVAVEAPAGVEALSDQNLGARARVGRHELPEPAVCGGPGVGAHWSAAPILARRASASACDMDLDEVRLVGERDIVAEPARSGFDPEGVGADCQSRSRHRMRERKRPLGAYWP